MGIFEFRNIQADETEQAILIEQICFPPNEACSAENMEQRIQDAPELFLAAIDCETGRIAGFLNGIATNETKFRDAFFTDSRLHKKDGDHIMILGLDVLPEYRGQGLARQLVKTYQQREQGRGRKKMLLTCLEEKVSMYEKFGFVDHGKADSTWGGEEWHEMSYTWNTH